VPHTRAQTPLLQLPVACVRWTHLRAYGKPCVCAALQVAAGYSDASEIVPFATALMSEAGGLSDRNKYAAVSHVSWFSEWFFPAFDVAGHKARPLESWSSALFDPFGGLNDVGKAFFDKCAPA
jgi:hypothetical protein